MKEIQSSIKATLYERVASPLWGALLTSWIAINWKILYITLFSKEEYLGCGKLEFIETYYLTKENLFIKPAILACVLLFIIPFISNGVFWIHLIFKKWKEDKKNEIEEKKILTIEKSVELRNILKSQNESFNKITEEKENEIIGLNTKIENREQELESLKETIMKLEDKINIQVQEIEKYQERLKTNGLETEIQKKLILPDSFYNIEHLIDFTETEKDIKDFLEFYELIISDPHPSNIRGNRLYSKFISYDLLNHSRESVELTAKGKKFAREIQSFVNK